MAHPTVNDLNFVLAVEATSEYKYSATRLGCTLNSKSLCLMLSPFISEAFVDREVI